MAPVEMDIIGNPCGAGRLDVRRGKAIWQREAEFVELHADREFELEEGDNVFVAGGSNVGVYDVVEAYGRVVINSYIGLAGGGCHYSLGPGGPFFRLFPGQTAYLPDNDNPVLKLRGI